MMNAFECIKPIYLKRSKQIDTMLQADPACLREEE
jgi:hypothetical protein